MIRFWKKYWLPCVTLLLTAFLIVYFLIANCHFEKNVPEVRSVSVTSIDNEAVLQRFDNGEWIERDSITTYTCTKTFLQEELSELDFVAYEDMYGADFNTVKYAVCVNGAQGTVTLYITYCNGAGDEVIEPLSGLLIAKEDGEIDAMFNVEDEVMYLSELVDVTVIDSVGLFSFLKSVLKAVVAIVVPVFALAAFVVTSSSYTLLKVTTEKAKSNYYNNINATYKVASLYTYKNKTYINTQRDFANYNIGFNSVQNGGCGAIAIYNALVAKGKIQTEDRQINQKAFANIIYSLETTSNTLVVGELGVNPLAISPIMVSQGLACKSFATKQLFQNAYENMPDSSVAILLYFWRKSDGACAAHYITVLKQSIKKYIYFSPVYVSEYTALNYSATVDAHLSFTHFFENGTADVTFLKGWIVE